MDNDTRSWKPQYEDCTMRMMGGYNILNTPSRSCPNVGKAVDGWAVLDHRGVVWPERFATRKDAAIAAYRATLADADHA